MSVALHYFRSTPPNFGDELNSFLWDRLIPELRTTTSDAVLVGIGTILNDRIPAGKRIVVMGSGAGLAPLPPGLKDGSIRVLAVRGPLTAALAGLDPELAVTDPALLLRTLYPALVRTPEERAAARAAFIPHFTTAADPGWQRACALAGVDFIDPTDNCERVIQKISSSRMIIAEAMHGAIVADAFRVPWVPVASTTEFSAFKWLDWTLSLAVALQVTPLPPLGFRHMVQRRWLELLGDDLLREGVASHGSSVLAAKDAHVVTTMVAERLAAPPGPYLAWFRLKLGAIHNRLVDPTAKWLGSTLFSRGDAHREAEIAAVFRNLVATSGFLSRRDVSDRKLAELLNAVAQLRTELQQTAPSACPARS